MDSINKLGWDMMGSHRSMEYSLCFGSNINSLVPKLQAINAPNDQTINALFSVAAEIVLCLISGFGCDLNVKGFLGFSVLHTACAQGNMGLVQALVRDHNADFNSQSDVGLTPLHVAALCGNAAVAMCLMSDFGCPEVTCQLHRSVLHYACQGGGVHQAVQKLIKYYKAALDVSVCVESCVSL